MAWTKALGINGSLFVNLESDAIGCCTSLSGLLLSEVQLNQKGKLMSDEKDAKAEAKAAKAKAKALRPWFKKKRFWLLGIIGIIVVFTVTSGSDSTTTTSSDSEEVVAENSTEDTISTGLGSKDATADIDSVDCGTVDSIGARYPEVKVTNRSEKTSTYFITVDFESSDGSTKYDETIIMITSLNPGQSMTEKGLIMGDIPDGAVCKVSEVQRTAD